MVSEWPIRAGTRDAGWVTERALLPPDAGARRVEDATVDLFIPDAFRLTDRLRASVSTMLDGVVRAIEREMRLTILPGLGEPVELAASLSSGSVDIVSPVLADARTLRHPPLISIVLRRAGEFVLAQRLVPEGSGAVDGLPVDDADPAVAAAAMALLVAEARRIDKFGEAALLLDDLPAELAHWLVWRVAAALRHYLCGYHRVDEATADGLLCGAAGAVLAGHDEGRGLHACAAQLASRLNSADRIDGDLLITLLGGGQVTAFNAALASALGLSSDAVWRVVADPAKGRLASLLRASRAGRDAAATVLLLIGGHDVAAEIEAFDACTPEAAHKAVSRLAVPAEYRAAVAAMDTALALAGVEA